MKNEPVLLIVAGIGTIVEAGLALLIAFGFELDGEQTAAILGFVAVVTTLVLAVLARGQVYSPASVERDYPNAAVDVGV